MTLRRAALGLPATRAYSFPWSAGLLAAICRSDQHVLFRM